MKHISFIGVGIMGKAMVRNLMKAGFSLTIYSRTRSKCEDVIAEGAAWADTVADCVKHADAVCTIVGYPPTWRPSISARAASLKNACRGLSGGHDHHQPLPSPARIWGRGPERDLPLPGRPRHRRRHRGQSRHPLHPGGRDEADFRACMPLFEAMGRNIVHFGGAGAGQHAKMANQIAIAGALSGVCEALTYAGAKGLDPNALLSAISTGAAGSFQMTAMGPKMVAGDFAPRLHHEAFHQGYGPGRRGGQGGGPHPSPVLQQVLGECPPWRSPASATWAPRGSSSTTSPDAGNVPPLIINFLQILTPDVRVCAVSYPQMDLKGGLFMLELPEAQTIARQLGETVLGREIISVAAGASPPPLRLLHRGQRRLSLLLTGRTIDAAYPWPVWWSWPWGLPPDPGGRRKPPLPGPRRGRAEEAPASPGPGRRLPSGLHRPDVRQPGVLPRR